MTERPDEENEEASSSSEAEGSDDGTINDPLTWSDVEAPQKPFGGVTGLSRAGSG